MKRTYNYLPVLLLGVALLGCTGGGRTDGEPTHEVTGEVTMNGSPVAGATVTFSPVGEQPAAFGRTGTDGTFTLTTYDAGDGAVAGNYHVLVSKSAGGSGAAAGPPGGHDPDNPDTFQAPKYPGKDSGSGSVLPEQYSKAETTPLTAEVTAGGENKFGFEL